MNKQQKEREEQVRLLKFDCEMRARSLEIASALSTSKNVKSLLDNADKLSKFIFGIPAQPKEKK
jgi:hypothetical protein